MEKKREKRRVDLPHNTEAEKAVLGAMIRSNTIYMDYIYKLSVEDFYEENENCVRTQFVDLYQKDVKKQEISLKILVCVRKQLYLCIVKRNKR